MSSGSLHGFRLLPWDTERFGFPVARIDAAIDAATLPVLRDALHEHRITLAYWFTRGRPSAAQEQLVAALGGSLVDEKRTYVAATRLEGFTADPRIREFHGDEPDERLLMLSRAAGAWSRFRIDPRVPPGVFEAIYDAWIRRSVRREIADVVLTAQEDGQAIGLVTVGRRGARADIGLVAVDAIARGRGVGRALVAAGVAWSRDHGFDEVQVVTQGANEPACALYEGCGFSLDAREFVYHLWGPFPRGPLEASR